MDGGACERACVKHIPHLGFPVLTLLTKLVVAPLNAHLNELKYLKKKKTEKLSVTLTHRDTQSCRPCVTPLKGFAV